MTKKVKVITLTLITLLIAQLLTILAPLSASSQGSDWKVTDVYWRSRADTSEVYPGSSNVELTVVTKYVGSSEAQDVAACIQLPDGFEISRGSSPCSPPYQPNTSKTYTIVHPGDVVIFRYHIDISKSVTPANYTLPINVSYSINGTGYQQTIYAYIVVSPYPNINLKVVDYYWNPTAYPGSAGVTLNIVLENAGNSTIVSAHVVINLPSVFTPTSARADIGTLDTNDRTTISINGIDVSVDASPNTLYPVTLKVDATARTKDGVDYTASQTLTVYVQVEKAPPVKLVIVSYGLSTPKSVKGEKLSNIYVEFQNKDFVTIRSITADFYVYHGASFTNGSKHGYATLSGSYDYGSYITVRSPSIVISNDTDFIGVKLTLTIFGSRNGANFWTTQEYNLIIRVEKPSIEVELVKSYWSSQVAYPGSSDLTLNVVLRNSDVVDLSNAVATLILPPGFYPRTLTVSGVSIASGRQLSVSFRGIDVSNSTAPGTYLAKLVINGLAKSESAFYPVTVEMGVPITVNSSIKHILSLVNVEWSGGRFYTTSANQGIDVLLRVAKPSTVSNVVIELHLPNQLILYNGNRSAVKAISGSFSYGSTISFSISGIYSATSRSTLVPVVIVVKALADVHGAQQWINEVFTALLRIEEPKLNLTLIDAKWSTNRCSPHCVGAEMYFTIQSLDMDVVRIMVVNTTLVSGGIFESGSRSLVSTWSGSLNYGEVTTIRVGPARIEGKEVVVKLTICATLSLGGGRYRACSEFSVKLTTTSIKPFMLASVQTIMNGDYAPILPAQKGLIIRLGLVNIDEYAVSSVKIEPHLPKGFIVRRVGGTCVNGVAAGSSCYIDIEIDTSSTLEAGRYEASVKLTIVQRIGSSVQLTNQSISFPLVVQQPDAYGPMLELTSWFWGRTQPQTVFEYEKHVPLTIIVANVGRYSAQSVFVHFEPINDSITVLMNAVPCANTLAPHSTCTATTYVDLGVGPGKALFKVIVEYETTSYGTLIKRVKDYMISLNIEKFAAGKGVRVVSSGWSNSWPVYPGTQNATYTITFANLWPYTISGMNITLILPHGFSHKGSTIVSTYVTGPVRSLDTFSSSFTISVGKGVAPGKYKAKVLIEYVVDVGGSQLKWVDVDYVDLEVNSIENSVTLVTTRWVEAPPEPGTYGAMLSIVFRDNYVPSMKGVILELELPPGFTCSVNNASIAKLPPMSVSMTPPTMTSSSIQQLLASLTGQQAASAATEVGEGQFITFLVPLNVLVSKPGTYYAKAVLNFIDHWGNVRKIEFEVPLRIIGFTKIVEISPLNQLSFENGSCDLALSIRNVGSAPLYDTYIYLIPKSPIAMPKSMVKYLGTVPPRRGLIVNFTLIYNPFSIVNMGGMAISYQSLPLVVSIVFKDALGYRHSFNTSVSVMIKPFIYIALGSDTRAEYREGSVVVSGTVINYGITTAHSVWVYACAEGNCSSTFVGDIDEASQAAFRVELPLPEPVTKVEVKVKYLDQYGVEHFKTFVLPVVVENVTTATFAAQRAQSLSIEHGIVIAAVVAFLAGVGIAIVRYLRKHSASEGV